MNDISIPAQRSPERGETQDRQAGEFSSQKTVFIVVQAGLAIWNIVRTDLFKRLLACRNLRIVIFSPLYGDDFKAEVEGANVIVEPLQQWKAGPIVKTLRSFRKDVWSEKHHVVRFKEKRATRRSRIGRGIVYKWLVPENTPEKIGLALEKLEAWETKMTPLLCSKYFDKYKPDLVFYTTIYSKDLAIEIGAKQRNIPSVAFVLSWDNPTTKGPFMVRPDRAVLWNNVMRDELIRYHDFSPDELFVSGPPQFDIYQDRSKYATKEQFFAKRGLDLNKKLITYTTGSRGMLPFEHETAEMIYDKIMAGALKQPAQLMVRLHPKDSYELYRHLEGKPGLILQLPGRRAKTDDLWNPSQEDMYGLGETMLYSDVVVNIASTITIDAAVFDTPIVNVAWDGRNEVPYEKSCRRYYKFNHYQKIVDTNGVRIAYDLDETMKHIQTYLDDPTREAEGRARIREEQCYKLDGRAGIRIAEYLISIIKERDAAARA